MGRGTTIPIKIIRHFRFQNGEEEKVSELQRKRREEEQEISIILSTWEFQSFVLNDYFARLVMKSQPKDNSVFVYVVVCARMCVR